MKKIFTAVAAVVLAISANAAALTVIHTTPGGFAEELTAALAEAGITPADITELTIISEYTEAGMAKDENKRTDADKANMSDADFKYIKDNYKTILKKVDLSGVYFPNHATNGGAWGTGGTSIMNGMQELEDALLPDDLEFINACEFENCPKLKTINIPSHLRAVRQYAFRKCPNLEISGTLPESVYEIGQEAFIGAMKLKLTGTLKGLKTVSKKAFEKTGVSFYGSLDAITAIGDQAFNESNVAFDRLGENLTKIGVQAFRKTQVTISSIPASCTSLGNAVFVFCPITEFTIDGVLCDNIPNQFFWFANPVTFYCRALTPPTANDGSGDTSTNSFNQANLGNVTMYVLKDAIEKYKSTSPYNMEYKGNKMTILPLESKVTITTDGENYGAEYLKIEHPHHGLLAHNQEHSIYEGEHEWTFTPGWNHHIESIRFVEPAGVKALAEEAEEEVADPNILYQLDPSVNKKDMAEKAVKVTVPVGPANRTLAVTYALTDPTQTSFEALVADSAAPEEIFDTMGRRINVAKDDLPAGIYIVRQGARTTKIVK